MWNLPNNANDAPADVGGALYVEELVEALLLGLLPQTGQREVEYAVEEDHDQNQHVAVVSCLVHSHNEAEPLHKQGQDQESGDDQGEGRSAHPERLKHKVAHVILARATVVPGCVDRVVPRGLSLRCPVLAIVEGHVVVASIVAVAAVATLAASVRHPIVYLVFDEHLVQIVKLAGRRRHFLLLLQRLVLNLLR